MRQNAIAKIREIFGCRVGSSKIAKERSSEDAAKKYREEF